MVINASTPVIRVFIVVMMGSGFDVLSGVGISMVPADVVIFELSVTVFVELLAGEKMIAVASALVC